MTPTLRPAFALRCLVSALVVLAPTSAFAATAKLTIPKTSYAPEEDFEVTFTVSAVLAESAWIGVIPSNVQHGSEDVNDQHDVAYQYLPQQTQGSLTFKAPVTPGKWDLRLNENDTGGREIASVSFTVRAPDVSKASLRLDRTTYLPGDKIALTFTAPVDLPQTAWIGLIPSSVAHGSEDTNDQHDVAYQYLEGKTSGTFEFEAPPQAGAWDFRMNENDASGREIASVSFTVRAPDVRGAALRLDRTTFNSGETIAVHFTAPADLPPHAWVGIVPSKVPHGKEDVNDSNDVDWQYLEKKTSGTLEFRAPVEAGAWDFRMNENDASGREIASVSFTVGAQVSAADLARQIKAQGRVSLYGIRFATGKADLDATATATLIEVGKLLKGDASLSLRIEGHTDDVGDAASNLDLSRRRAEAVRTYLVQREGIAANRLTAEGFGETRPVAKNDTPEGKAQNRRVELVRR